MSEFITPNNFLSHFLFQNGTHTILRNIFFFLFFEFIFDLPFLLFIRIIVEIRWRRTIRRAYALNRFIFIISLLLPISIFHLFLFKLLLILQSNVKKFCLFDKNGMLKFSAKLRSQNSQKLIFYVSVVFFRKIATMWLFYQWIFLSFICFPKVFCFVKGKRTLETVLKLFEKFAQNNSNRIKLIIWTFLFPVFT